MSSKSITSSAGFQLLGSIIFIVLTIIVREIFSYYDSDIQVAISINCIWALIVYLWLIFCCSKVTTSPVSLYSLLILFSFLFYFGQHFVVLMGKSDYLIAYYRSILDGRIPPETRVFAGYYILIILLVLNIGIVLGRTTAKRHPVKRRADPSLYDSCTKMVAWAIFIAVTVPTLYKYYIDATNTIVYGYSDTMEAAADASGLYKVCYFLSYYFLPSVYLLLISYAKSPKKTFVIFVYFVFSIIYLMTGSRFRIFESIVAILLIYNYKIKLIEKRGLILAVFLGFIILFAFSVIREVRDSSALLVLNPSVAVSEITKGVLEEGVLTGALMETGSTFQIIENVLYHCPSVVPYSYGFSFVGAILIALPSFLRGDFEAAQVSVSSIFSPEYISDMNIGMGSSFIAEAYYNFGYFSVVFVLLFGLFIGRLLVMPERLHSSGSNFDFFKFAYLSSLICFSIRTDLVSYLRYYIYYVLLIQFAIWILYSSILSKNRSR